MNKLTPGPWRVEDLGIPWSDALAVVGADGGAICYTTRGLECRDEGDSRAFDHARLIAAAPEMYAIVKELRDELAPNYSISPEGRAYLHKMEAALRKVEGK